MISVYGKGFIGSHFLLNSKNRTIPIEKYQSYPKSNESLYFISTTHNYHVHEDVHKDIDTNLNWLMECLSKHNPGDTFNFISSWFVYGRPWGREASACFPKGFYSITKHCAELLLESYCKTKGINYRILRLANVYGPGDKNASKKKNAMQWLVGEVKRGNDVELYNGGNTTRDYIHVRDVVTAIDLILEKAPLNSIYNIGSGRQYKMKSIINYAKKITGSKSKIIDIRPSEFHKQVQVENFGMNVDKLHSLGFKQTITMKRGLQELCR